MKMESHRQVAYQWIDGKFIMDRREIYKDGKPTERGEQGALFTNYWHAYAYHLQLLSEAKAP